MTLLKSSIPLLALLIGMGCTARSKQDKPASSDAVLNSLYNHKRDSFQIFNQKTLTTTEVLEDFEGNVSKIVLKVGIDSLQAVSKSHIEYFYGGGLADDMRREVDENFPLYLRHVIEMDLSIEGKKIDISKDAYADLIDLKLPTGGRTFWKGDSLSMLYFEGSDAGESYRVKFFIKDRKVVEREVWFGEFPEIESKVATY